MEIEPTFAAHAAALTNRNLRLILTLVAAAALLWWPLDWLLFGDEAAAVGAFARGRASVLAVCVVGWLALHVQVRRRRPPWLVVALVVAAIPAAAGWHLAAIGSPDHPLVSAEYLFPMLSVALMVPTGWRVALTSLVPVAFAAAYFGHVPRHLGAASLPYVASYTAFSCALAVFGGRIFYRLERENHAHATAAKRRAIDLERAIRDRSEHLVALAARLRDTQDEERRWLARELHDELGQHLGALRLQIDWAASERNDGNRDLQSFVTETEQILADLNAAKRQLLARVRLPLLEADDKRQRLQALVRGWSERARIPVELELDPALEQLEASTLLAIYRIVQEALSNVAKHAGACRARVELRLGGDEGLLVVADDGAGFDPEQARTTGQRTGRFGLLTIAERAWALRGHVQIDARPGSGTRLSVRFPKEA